MKNICLTNIYCYKKKKGKHRLILLTIFFLIISILFIGYNNRLVSADNEDKSLEEQLTESVENQLSKFDFNSFQESLDNLNTEQKSIFGNDSFLGKIKKLIKGEGFDEGYNIFNVILELFFEGIVDFIPLLASVVGIAIISSFMTQIKPSGVSFKSLGDIIHFVCYSVIIILVITSSLKVFKSAGNTISSIKTQMELIFPILLTIVTAIGGTNTSAVYQPSVLFLTNGIVHIFTAVLLPIFVIIVVFNIISNLSSNVKLDKFCSFFTSIFKWIIGIVFTIFIAFLSLQGITASSIDGISIKTAKYAIKSYIPLLGGYLSDGFNVILASSVLIKNAIGTAGLILVASIIIGPIIKILVLSLSLKLTSAILEPLTDNRISNFLYGIAKSLTLLIVCILGIAFMYIITVGLIMLTLNGV